MTEQANEQGQAAGSDRSTRKVREGYVVGDKMDKNTHDAKAEANKPGNSNTNNNKIL